MENFDLTQAIVQLYEKYPELTDRLSDLLNESWSHEARGTLLNVLSELLVNEKYTIHVAELFSPLLLELIQRYAADSNEGENTPKYELLCVCLAKLVGIYPEAAKFAKLYFERAAHVLHRLERENNVGPPSKKQKVEDTNVTDEKLLETALRFLMFDTVFFKEAWNWSVLVSLLDHAEPRVRWFAYHCLAHVGNIRTSDLNTILQEKFGDEQYSIFTVQDSMLFSQTNYILHKKKTVTENEDLQRKIESSDLSSKVVDVSGVLINKLLQDEEEKVSPKIVCVPSVQKALKSLALAVSTGDAILLQGAVGCGKTSLVEHLAEVSGRKLFENLLKVQLGEHMDSRMLVGCHSCTEVPGEFIWQPGLLTQAMTEGQWLLLEDIDCAPLDVISLLAPVLKSKTLFLPGHSKPIEVANGFQLFATQRLLRGFDGTYLEFQSNADMIVKLWRKVIVNSLSREELIEVISSKWPVLLSAVDRILDIYYIFSNDPNACEPQENGHITSNGVSLSTKPGRLISTRDLFKFCDRISKQFDIKSTDTAIDVFLNAIECFCESVVDVEEKLKVAEVVGVKLNLPQTKAAFFLQKNMPAVESFDDSVKVGRAHCKKQPASFMPRTSGINFAHTRQAASLLEKVAFAVTNKEPVLLVGETGTGKTSIVQYLASLTNNKLTVINMNQQSDSIDLVGGYKPVDIRFVIGPVRDLYEKLFPATFSKTQNSKFMNHIANCFYHKQWTNLCTLILHTQKNAILKLSRKSATKKTDVKLQAQWMLLGEKVLQLKLQIQQSDNPLAFKFIEGALVKAMKQGDWLLLDEINLAEAETLECLAGVLERDDNSLFLLENGDKEPIKCHPDFRIFACMNPATDVGKKDLPVGIRNRFTEFFVEELSDKQDLMILVHSYLQKLVLLNQNNIQSIVNFYLYIKKQAVEKLSDGTGHHPHYSLRTLCRALSCAAKNLCEDVQRSLYEAFCLSFLSQLDLSSHPFVNDAIVNKVLQGRRESLKMEIPQPATTKCILIEGYWVPAGELEPKISPTYIITDTVKKNLHDLARIVSSGRYPVLLQGETSVGKTSLVQWLAHATGNQCLRVNNHEHTDIQEYVGTYSANSKGKLIFKEGILVEAMKNGYWIILDELNLAPTDVMEALNRVLDDNRELFIAETQETVKAHPQFMVFATQNPPGTYGGRKILSRAFRNRFIELHFNEIPPAELETILGGRCLLPPSRTKKLVAIMQDLQLRRRESGVFAGKHGFITLRDLFRWGERYRLTKDDKNVHFDWDQHLADEGYMLLAGRVRRNEEAEIIREVILKHLKKTVDPKQLFGEENASPMALKVMKNELMPLKFGNIVWTYNMRRLAVLVGEALKFNEPILLVGETGCGKTTVCQMYAEAFGSNLHTVNCHLHSESADFLGGLRPIRDENSAKFFEWVDGPLIQAMKKGDFFLTDEISLADDSVLERLNSVLEPERSVLLAEKGFEDKTEDTVITAEESFKFMATMNPGGDFGKKELSPALRNRFTEIWCPNDLEHVDLVSIVKHNIKRAEDLPYFPGALSGYGVAMADFIKYFLSTDVGKRTTVSIRDILTWVEFINATDARQGKISANDAYIHGAFLVFIDSIGSGIVTASTTEELKVREDLLKFLLNQVQAVTTLEMFLPEYKKDAMKNYEAKRVEISDGTSVFEIGPFAIQTGPLPAEDLTEIYVLDAPTPKANALRILRAMQLPKPILLEGNPGVGKTSLVTAMARASGHQLVRINLSDQTDISDLFGADLPVEGGSKGKFAWRDGPFIQALKHGHWILLDELNLASQTVLEGLNSCLDHRNEIYVPETGKTFHLEKYNSRIFGCQNPHKQGGSRKGLPRSFLNRFTQVYLKSLSPADMEIIATSMYPTIPVEMVESMVTFNEMIVKETRKDPSMCHSGYQFDFNLRDVLRWCEALVNNQEEEDFTPAEYVHLIYAERMKKKEKIYRMCDSVFDCCLDVHCRPLHLNVFDTGIQLGYSLLPRLGNNRAGGQSLCVLHSQLPTIESVMKCLEMKWMPILIGPAASGKSSIVQILASLTGHPLQVMNVNSEMDTTELLGGFEQADLSRHVDSAFQELEPSIEHAICHSMQMGEEGNMHQLHNLMYLVDKMKKVSFSHMPEDAFRHRQKVKYMLEIIKFIKETPISMDARSVLTMNEESLQNLDWLLKSSEETSTCGKFEWMDSALVQAVRKGHWLVIDNANFCSPSVLDRLNGLLEPKGVLTITEQGVIGDELITVVPHPEFRIILTMDPRHGPISRAMRNRGVEIFLEPLNCGKDVMVDKWDLVSVIENQGLTHVQLIKHLLKIHQKLLFSKECDEPSVYELTKAAALIKQLLQKHVDPKTALAIGCETVYAENVLNASMKKAISEVIHTTLSEEPPIRVDFDVLQASYLSLSPTINEYQQNSVLASVKKLTLLLTYVLRNNIENCSVDNSQDFNPTGELLIPHALTERLTLSADWVLLTIIRIIFDYCSIRDWKLVSVWLEHHNHAMAPRLVELLLNYKRIHLNVFLTDPLLTNWITHLSEIVADSHYTDVDREEMPLDPKWNPYIHKKLLQCVEKAEECGEIENFSEEADEKLISSTNRLKLKLFAGSKQFLYADLPTLSKIPIKSLFKMSANHASNKVLLKDLPYPWVAKLYPLLSGFYDAFSNFLESTSISDDDYWNMRYALNLFYLFAKDCCGPIHGQLDALCCEIKMYWKWFMKHSEIIFVEKTRFSKDLKQLIVQLTHDLVPKDVELKLRSKIVKEFGAPPAFIDEKVAGIATDVHSLFQVINLALHLLPDNISKDVSQLTITNASKWIKTLTDAAFFCLSYDQETEFYEVHSAVNLIKLQLRDNKLLASDDDDDIMEVCPTPIENPTMTTEELQIQARLLTLYDFVFVLSEIEIISEVASLSLKMLDEDDHSDESLQFEIEISDSFLSTVGTGYLGLDPFEMAQLMKLHETNPPEAIAATFVYFSRHLRDGLAANGISCYRWILGDNEEAIKTKMFNPEFIWYRQTPLLTFLFSSMMSGRTGFRPKFNALLGEIPYKILQVEAAKHLLWTNFDKLSSSKESFRMSAANLVMSCFSSLLYLLPGALGLKLSTNLFSAANQPRLFEKIGSSLKALIVSDLNILTLAADAISHLKTEISKKIVHTSNLQWCLGQSFAYVGLLTYIVMLPRDIMDPVSKHKLKLTMISNQLKESQTELSLRNWLNTAITGQDLDSNASSVHPYITGLSNECQELDTKKSELEKISVHRPPKDQFPTIQMKCNQYMNSFGSPATLLDLIKKVESLKGSIPDADRKLILQKIDNWSQNQRNFADSLTNEFPLYRDITLPFVDGIDKVLMGVQMMIRCIESQEVCSKLPCLQMTPPLFTSAEDFLSTFCCFPICDSRSPLEFARLLIDEQNSCHLDSFSALLSSNNNEFLAQSSICKLIKASLLEVINEAVMSRTGNRDALVKVTMNCLHQFYKSWCFQEEIIRKRREEKEETYKHKVLCHQGELNDAAKIEKRLKKHFPSYNEEFENGDRENGVEDDDEDPKKVKPEPAAEEHTFYLSKYNKLDVWKMHATLISMLSQMHQNMSDPGTLQNILKDTTSPDFLTPHILRYDVVNTIINELGIKLDASLDKKLVGAHLLAANRFLESCQGKDTVNPHLEHVNFNIYHDADPSAVLNIQPLLKRLRERVTLLLVEYDEHPSLLKILRTVNQLFKLNVSEPLLKFLEGLEITLAAAQDWEENANKNNSLIDELQSISVKILEWRKLELNSWSESLNSVEYKQFKNCADWWFHIYSLTVAPEDEESWDETKQSSLLTTLQEFLECSALAQFPARLSLVHTFLQTFQIQQSSVWKRKQYAIFFNIFMYYNQFLKDVKESIRLIRAPFEKVIKDFIKVAKWKDTNYHAMKSAVLKSRRTVIKQTSGYKDKLRKQIAKESFVIPSKNEFNDKNYTPWVLKISKWFSPKESLEVTKVKDIDTKKFKSLANLPRRQKTLKQLSDSIVKNFPTVKHVNALSEFSGEIVSSLLTLTPTEDTSKKDTRKTTSLLMQKKKRALLDLFKCLQRIGLSYRQGILHCDKKLGEEAMSVPALSAPDLKMCGNYESANEVYLFCSKDANHYFYKSIIQFVGLQKALESPSKDLVIGILHRTKGYSGHLMQIVIDQRQTLALEAKSIDYFNSCVKSLNSLAVSLAENEENRTILPPQHSMMQSQAVLSNLLVKTLTTLEQFKIFLECCPTSSSISPSEQTAFFKAAPPQTQNASRLALVSKDGDVWTDIYKRCNQCISSTKELIGIVSQSFEGHAHSVTIFEAEQGSGIPEYTQSFGTWQNMASLSSCFKGLQGIASDLMAIVESVGADGFTHFTSGISTLTCLVMEEWRKFKDVANEVREQATMTGQQQTPVVKGEKKVVKLCSQVVKHVLLAVQNTTRFCTQVAEEEAKEKEEGEDGVEEGLLTKKVGENLLQVKKKLRMNKIMMLMMKLMRTIRKYQDCSDSIKGLHNGFCLLLNITPLLTQYLQLLKVYLAVNFGKHRNSCKLLSIVLNTLNIVITKGYCLPPELQKEALKGDTQFLDIEKGGIGEGEGENDVSKEITSEAQIEGTKNEEKGEQDDDKKVPDEKHGIEMSEDFDAKAFDPDDVNEEEEEEEEEEQSENEEDLEEKMGDVDDDEAEKMDEKMWGNDSDDENEDNDLRNDESMSGVPQNKSSELAAKDDKTNDRDTGKEKENKLPKSLEEANEEYDGEHEDPLIDQPPEHEAKDMQLPENMQMEEETGAGEEEEKQENEDAEVEEDREDDAMDTSAKDSDVEAVDKEEGGEANADENEEADVENKEDEGASDSNTQEMAAEDDDDVEEEDTKPDADSKDEKALPTQALSKEMQILPSEDQKKKSSRDPVVSEDMEWEGGAKEAEEQHREGQGEADSSLNKDPGHVGQKPSVATQPKFTPQLHKKMTFKPPSEKRTLEDAETTKAKRRPMAEQQTTSKKETDQEAELYEHVDDPDVKGVEAVDIATQEQATRKPVEEIEEEEEYDEEEEEEYEDEVIQLDSSSDEEDQTPSAAEPGPNQRQDTKKFTKSGAENAANSKEPEEGDIIKTHTVQRGDESTIHTQHSLWSSLSSNRVQERRKKAEMELWSRVGKDDSSVPDELWRTCETNVAHLSQELCEQLRLVLEPTKMSKLRGDYRTGKRLNMRKIIPYIASQFRKDKIWLRRTKPSKRQYQIMLAMDDSSSMADNHSKQLAFESLAVMGKSLSLLEAGELAVVSFGERVELLLGFQEPFTTCTGARILQQFSFAQKKTNIAQLVSYATDAMIQSRGVQSRLMSKEIAQLLVIISDGRGIFNEGEEVVLNAIRRARENNVFMVFLVMDSPLNKDSILDIRCPVFDSTGLIEMKSYMEKFPFPFYILLREISSLPLVLGEALRQWFELVTSAER